MNRRDLLRSLALAAAFAPPLFAREPLSSAAMCASNAGRSPGRASAAFVLPDSTRRLIGVIGDLMIPQTDTLGASAAGVVEFIEFMLGNWFSAQERDEFLRGLVALDALSRDKYGADFATAGSQNQTVLLTQLETQATQPGSGSLDPESFISRIKLLVLTGYYTSEVGASVELDNTMIFPSLEGCIDLGPDDRGQSMAVPAPSAL